MGKPHLSIRTTLLIILGILNLLIASLVGSGVYASWESVRQARALKEGWMINDALYEASKNLSLERAASLSVMFVAPESAQALREDLKTTRKKADEALNVAFLRLKDPVLSGEHRNGAQIEEKRNNLIHLRSEMDATLEQSLASRDDAIPNRLFDASVALIAEIRNFILAHSLFYKGIDAATNRQVMFKYFVWELAEYTGEEYALIGALIARDKRPTPAQQEQLISLGGRIQYGWEIVKKFPVDNAIAQKLRPFIDEAQTQNFMTFDQIKDLFYGAQPTGADTSYPVSIEMWLGMASQAVDSLLSLQMEVSQETRDRIELIEEKAKREMIMSALVFMCALGLSLYCWSVIVFRVARPVNAMVNALYRATREDVFEIPKISYARDDEIGKLVRVLKVFQENARKMKQSNEELEQFAYIAAHDLKSPLRAVDNISQWLEEDLAASLQPHNRKYMEELRSRVRLMDKLLDDTLDYARAGEKLETGSGGIVSGAALVDEIMELLAPQQEFSVKTSARLSRIAIPKWPVQQVLYNLVSNAVTHHDKASGVIEIDAQESDFAYIFSVRDDGPGIAPQYHHKIFEMFQTLDARGKVKGRGVGLAIAKKIVATNGGIIGVKSDPGKGSTFSFTWPKMKPETQGEDEDDADAGRRYA